MPEIAQRLVWLWIPVNRSSSKNDSSHTWHTCEKRFIVNPIFGPHPFEAVLQCRRTFEQPAGGICGMSIRCVQSHVFFPTVLSPHQAAIGATFIETYTLLTQGFLKDMSLRFLTSSISWYILQHSCSCFFLKSTAPKFTFESIPARCKHLQTIWEYSYSKLLPMLFQSNYVKVIVLMLVAKKFDEDKFVAVEYFGSFYQTLRPGLNWAGCFLSQLRSWMEWRVSDGFCPIEVSPSSTSWVIFVCILYLYAVLLLVNAHVCKIVGDVMFARTSTLIFCMWYAAEDDHTQIRYGMVL